ncbi:hypothetical protein [Saccharothrix stipae]
MHTTTSRLTSGTEISAPCAGPCVPLTTKTAGVEGYVADHPTGIVEFCDTCRTFWPATTLAFDAATGGLICPACRTADTDPARPALGDTLTGHQQALIQQATPDIPGDGRWMRLPEISGLTSYRDLTRLTNLGVAYRSGDQFLLTAAGRDIHRHLTTAQVNA